MLSKTEGMCAFCGSPLESRGPGVTERGGTAWVVEHWVPKAAMGVGADELINLWPACLNCSVEKAGGNGSEYVLYRLHDGKPLHARVNDFVDDVGDWFTRKVLGLDRIACQGHDPDHGDRG